MCVLCWRMNWLADVVQRSFKYLIRRISGESRKRRNVKAAMAVNCELLLRIMASTPDRKKKTKNFSASCRLGIRFWWATYSSGWRARNNGGPGADEATPNIIICTRSGENILILQQIVERRQFSFLEFKIFKCQWFGWLDFQGKYLLD